MRIFRVFPVLVLATSLVHAQHPSRTATPPAATVSREASQFDFLVGHWELTVRPKVSGLAARIHGAPRLLGSWKAWKVLDGHAIEDELRIVDGSGNPTALSLAVRVWNATDRRWMTTAVDGPRGRITTGTAAMAQGRMELTGRGSEPGALTRSRFTDITPTSFKFVQDRSSDDGKNWDEAALVIEARRISATAPR
ncbi:MAG: hypothetical protein JNJ98_06790 [Gemmatimonadetes bacterium]|nr:hypothetical protein [Gemmatimonadota bacterium]